MNPQNYLSNKVDNYHLDINILYKNSYYIWLPPRNIWSIRESRATYEKQEYNSYNMIFYQELLVLFEMPIILSFVLSNNTLSGKTVVSFPFSEKYRCITI